MIKSVERKICNETKSSLNFPSSHLITCYVFDICGKQFSLARKKSGQVKNILQNARLDKYYKVIFWIKLSFIKFGHIDS